MLQSEGASKSILYVTIKKLKAIRRDCGILDEDEQREKRFNQTGDPFKDVCTEFTTIIQACSRNVDERNEAVKKFGQDRGVIEQTNEIMVQMRELDFCLKRIRELVGDADETLAKAYEKNAPPDQLRALEMQYNQRMDTFRECEEAMRALREKNQRRFDGSGGGILSKNQQIRLGAKNAMREQLLAMRRGGNDLNNPTDMNNGVFGGAMATGDASTFKPRRLEDDPLTREQMKQIQADNERIEKGLDNISAGVARLKQLAIDIGAEINLQNTKLGETEVKVEEQTVKIQKVNTRLTALIKKSRPLSIFINIFCLILLAGLVGFLLWQFDVI